MLDSISRTRFCVSRYFFVHAHAVFCNILRINVYRRSSVVCKTRELSFFIYSAERIVVCSVLIGFEREGMSGGSSAVWKMPYKKTDILLIELEDPTFPELSTPPKYIVYSPLFSEEASVFYKIRA